MSFLKQLFGGSTTPTPHTQPATAATQVTFLREVRKPSSVAPNIQATFKIYSAPNREAARAFLRNQNITESFLYIEVETPSGLFGIDRMGNFYDSGGLQVQKAPSQAEISEWKALSKAFHDAAANGELGKVKAMLEDHPNLVVSRIVNFGDTPLHAAARKGHKDVVELLLAEGSDVNVVDQNDQTPLHNTAGNGHKAVVELLLARGAGVNAKMHNDLTPLHMAVSNGHKNVVQLLLDNKADINAKTKAGGKTPLAVAEEKGYKDVVELLRTNGGHE
jgi:ankyrin repeat protein